MKNSMVLTLLLAALALGCKNKETGANNSEGLEDSAAVQTETPSFFRAFTFNSMSFEIQTKGNEAVKTLRVLANEKNNPVHLFEEPIEGSVLDVFANDLNLNGKVELYVHIDSPIENNYTLLKIYEFSGGNHTILTLPNLTEMQSKNYKGNDKYQLEGQRLVRTYPVFPTGSTDKSKATVETITYELTKNGEFKIVN